MNVAFFRFFYQASYHICLALSPLAFPFSKKLRSGMLQRLGLNSRLKNHFDKSDEQPLWIHFASSGELEQAIPIAEEIRRRTPKQNILFTYFSPSGARGLNLEQKRREQKQLPLPWDYADYCPLDTSCAVKKTLETVNPKALILINREIWPELVLQCAKKKIPTYLFASYFPRYKARAIGYLKPLLSTFRRIGSVGESTTQLVHQTLPQLAVETVGDTRIERVLQRKQMPKPPVAYASFFNQTPLFLAASIWPEDFEALKISLNWMAKEAKHWRIILVPHEPEEHFIESIKDWGKSSGLVFRKFSHFLQSPDDISPLIFDKVGGLAELYQFSKIAFVGGSFRKRIHNVLEPAAYQNAILTGPLIENSFEATEMNEQSKGLKRCADAAELLNAVKFLIENPERLKKQGELTHQYLIDRTGAAKKYVDLLDL